MLKPIILGILSKQGKLDPVGWVRFIRLSMKKRRKSWTGAVVHFGIQIYQQTENPQPVVNGLCVVQGAAPFAAVSGP